MRLSVAVQLLDDLTGMSVRGSNARVWIEGQRPPIKKDDGRSVFVDLPAGEYVLKAEGGFYSRTELECKVSDGRTEYVTIRLTPNAQYPVPDDIVRIEGKADPGLEIKVFPSDRGSAYKLLSEAEKGSDVLGIYHSGGENIEGKLLKIISSDDKSEYFRIMSAAEGDRSEYLLSGKLGSGYPKIGTIIVPVSECTADEKGNFVILIKRGAGRELTAEYNSKGKKKYTQKTIDISGSNNINLDLT